MSARMLLLEGDGVGPEVFAEARRVLRHSFDRPEDATLIETAMRRALGRGVRTPDIAGAHRPVGTRAMADAVLQELEALD